MKNRLILASGSPRRIDMFHEHGYDPEIIPSGKEERVPTGLTPEETVLYLSFLKARDVEERIMREPAFASGKEAGIRTFVVGADTIVWLPDDGTRAAKEARGEATYKGKILGKPKDEEDARQMLRDLRNCCNHVLTGVTVLEAGTTNRRSFADLSKVYMKDYDESFIRAYVATGETMDKSGGYAVQGGQAEQVLRVEGDICNVIGLPWTRTEALLKEMGWE